MRSVEDDPLARAEGYANKVCPDPLAGCFEDVAAWFERPDPPEAPIVKGLLDAGEMLAVVGQSKAGKSYFTLQMALSIASGRPFLEVYETVQTPVCIVNAEVSERQYKKRTRQMCAQLGLVPKALKEWLVIGNLKGEDANWSTVLAACKAHGCKVVIVDPFYQIAKIPESDEMACQCAIEQMKLFQKEGIALIVVFHSPKGFSGDRQLIDMISGSSMLARFPEGIVGVMNHRDEKSARVINAILRNHESPEPYSIAFKEGAFEITEDFAPVVATAKNNGGQITNYASDEEITKAITVTIHKRKITGEDDGFGTPIGEFVREVKLHLFQTIDKKAGDKRIRDNIEVLSKMGTIAVYKPNVQYAKKFVGEVDIRRAWKRKESNNLPFEESQKSTIAPEAVLV